MKKCILFIILIFICKLSVSEQPWFYYYKLAIENYNNNQYQLALSALDKAIELNPNSSSNARTYGMNFIEYYPYFYKAMSFFSLQMYNEAKNSLELELKRKEIQNSKTMYNKALI